MHAVEILTFHQDTLQLRESQEDQKYFNREERVPTRSSEFSHTPEGDI